MLQPFRACVMFSPSTLDERKKTMHPNMKRLLGRTNKPIIFHAQTWPAPVDNPNAPETAKKDGK
jgi:hypothetical protein